MSGLPSTCFVAQHRHKTITPPPKEEEKTDLGSTPKYANLVCFSYRKADDTAIK